MALIRAAAKSHRDVWVVVDPRDYADVVGAIDADNQTLGDALRAYDERERAKHYRANPRGTVHVLATHTGERLSA